MDNGMEEILKEYGNGMLAVMSGLFFLTFLVGAYHAGGGIREAMTDFLLGVCG